LRPPRKTKSKTQNKVKTVPGGEKTKAQSRVPVTALMGWPRFTFQEQNHRAPNRWQHRLKRERPTCTERNKSLLESADGSMATVAPRQNESSSYEKPERIHLTPTGLLMEGHYAHNPVPFRLLVQWRYYASHLFRQRPVTTSRRDHNRICRCRRSPDLRKTRMTEWMGIFPTRRPCFRPSGKYLRHDDPSGIQQLRHCLQANALRWRPDGRS
jgi:hypothetical protein